MATAIATDAKYNFIRQLQRKCTPGDRVLPLIPFNQDPMLPPIPPVAAAQRLSGAGTAARAVSLGQAAERSRRARRHRRPQAPAMNDTATIAASGRNASALRSRSATACW